MKINAVLLFILLGALSLPNYSASLTLESPAFGANTLIPSVYTCENSDKSPPLKWENAPAHTKSFTLIVNDPDAPSGVWTHWILFNIPSDIMQLQTGTTVPNSATEGNNSWNNVGYKGPCPPYGRHRYVFTLYAMDNVLNLKEGVSTDNIIQAMTGHVIEKAILIGYYEK